MSVKSNGMGREAASRAVFASADDELWNFKTVVAKTGLSRSSIYSYFAQGLFPRQRRLGPAASVGSLPMCARGYQ
jgi:predicted DNA-binding transcriptional regulator AlpA